MALYLCAVIGNWSLTGGWGLPIVTGECEHHSFKLHLCSLYKLEQISAEEFECKTVLHPAKYSIASQFGCTSSCDIQLSETDWTGGVVWHVDEMKVFFHHLVTLTSRGKNQQELFDCFDPVLYLIEASFFFQ